MYVKITFGTEYNTKYKSKRTVIIKSNSNFVAVVTTANS
jgi:hypothetical protein